MRRFVASEFSEMRIIRNNAPWQRADNENEWIGVVVCVHHGGELAELKRHKLLLTNDRYTFKEISNQVHCKVTKCERFQNLQGFQR